MIHKEKVKADNTGTRPSVFSQNTESTAHIISHVIPFELGYQSSMNTHYIDSPDHVFPADVSEGQIQCDTPNHNPHIQMSPAFHAGTHDE